MVQFFSRFLLNERWYFLSLFSFLFCSGCVLLPPQLHSPVQHPDNTTRSTSTYTHHLNHNTRTIPLHSTPLASMPLPLPMMDGFDSPPCTPPPCARRTAWSPTPRDRCSSPDPQQHIHARPVCPPAPRKAPRPVEHDVYHGVDLRDVKRRIQFWTRRPNSRSWIRSEAGNIIYISSQKELQWQWVHERDFPYWPPGDYCT